jgi:hypothetical protein
MLHNEVVQERNTISSFVNFIYAHCVNDHLDEPAIWTRGQNLIRFEPEGQLLNLEYLIDLGYELHGELLLPDIID